MQRCVSLFSLTIRAFKIAECIYSERVMERDALVRTTCFKKFSTIHFSWFLQSQVRTAYLRMVISFNCQDTQKILQSICINLLLHAQLLKSRGEKYVNLCKTNQLCRWIPKLFISALFKNLQILAAPQ